MNFFTKNKVIAGVIGVLAVVSVVNTQAILKLSNSVWGNITNQSISLNSQNQSAQTINFSAKITDGEVYKRGDKSETILKVQEVLAVQGLYKGSISGLIGPKTEQAIIDFQKANGLKVTGVLDQNTVDAILKNRDIRPTTNTVSTIIPACNRDSDPWIMVTSPNGGEVYQAAGQFIVTWQSCKINSEVNISLETSAISQSLSTMLAPQTQNDGSQMVVLPEIITPGQYYIQVSGTSVPNWANDFSNNSFTITDEEDCAEGTIIGYNSDGTPIYCGDGEVGCAEGTVIGYNPDGTPIYCGGVYNDCAEGTIIGYTQNGTPIYCGGDGDVDTGCAEGTIIGYNSDGTPIYCGDEEVGCAEGTVIGYNSDGTPIYCQ